MNVKKKQLLEIYGRKVNFVAFGWRDSEEGPVRSLVIDVNPLKQRTRAAQLLTESADARARRATYIEPARIEFLQLRTQATQFQDKGPARPIRFATDVELEQTPLSVRHETSKRLQHLG